MSTYQTTLTARLLLPGSGGALVQATFFYRSADPVSIVVHFHTDLDEPVEWVFSRDLLDAGLTERTGQGDVVVWSEDQSLHLSLTSPFGSAEFTLERPDIMTFLGKTFDLVPKGHEFDSIDLDAALAAFLGDSDTL